MSKITSSLPVLPKLKVTFKSAKMLLFPLKKLVNCQLKFSIAFDNRPQLDSPGGIECRCCVPRPWGTPRPPRCWGPARPRRRPASPGGRPDTRPRSVGQIRAHSGTKDIRWLGPW